jgi:hypothetical protein
MDSFKKRQKEIRRLERQREKIEKRKELKARKAAGIAAPQDPDTEILTDGAPSPGEAALPPIANQP